MSDFATFKKTENKQFLVRMKVGGTYGDYLKTEREAYLICSALNVAYESGKNEIITSLRDILQIKECDCNDRN